MQCLVKVPHNCCLGQHSSTVSALARGPWIETPQLYSPHLHDAYYVSRSERVEYLIAQALPPPYSEGTYILGRACVVENIIVLQAMKWRVSNIDHFSVTGTIKL